MVIRHSLQLLEQLSEIEDRIRFWENLARTKGLEIDSELLLKVAWNEYLSGTSRAAVFLTKHGDVS